MPEYAHAGISASLLPVPLSHCILSHLWLLGTNGKAPALRAEDPGIKDHFTLSSHISDLNIDT